MTRQELSKRFDACMEYKQAPSWKKPLIDPARFAGNQLRKFGLITYVPGECRQVDSFHLDGFTVVNGECVSELIASYGIYEEFLTLGFLALIRPGDVVLDVGMHLGYFATLFAALSGPAGEVHAFEPTPCTRNTAAANTRRFPQISVHPNAVWSSAGLLTLRDYGPQWSAYNSVAASRLQEGRSPFREFEVQSITLDGFCKELRKPVAMVKIDAESAEQQILQGAMELLNTQRPILSIEVGDESGPLTSRTLIDWLAARGYAPWESGADGLRRHAPKTSYEYDNLVFAPVEKELSGRQ